MSEKIGIILHYVQNLTDYSWALPMLLWLQYFREMRICRDIHGVMMGVSMFLLVIFPSNSFI